MLGLPHEHGSKPELPGCKSPGKDFFFFNYLFLTARGFCCCTWVSLVLVSRDYSSRCSGFSC